MNNSQNTKSKLTPKDFKTIMSIYEKANDDELEIFSDLIWTERGKRQ